MKKHILILPLAMLAGLTQLTYAKEQSAELSKSCLKDYPSAAGDTDLEIIALYSQMCNKANKKNEIFKQEQSLKIAQRYQALGFNLKSLEVINQLRTQNVHSRELTDLTFLAGISIAQNALNQMRTNELRSLSEEAYVPAKQLGDSIRFAQPAAEKPLETAADADKPKIKKPQQTGKTVLPSARSPKTSSVKTAKMPAVKPLKKETVQSKPASAPAASGASPFASLNKK